MVINSVRFDSDKKFKFEKYEACVFKKKVKPRSISSSCPWLKVNSMLWVINQESDLIKSSNVKYDISIFEKGLELKPMPSMKQISVLWLKLR